MKGVSEEEMKENPKSQGVTSVKRIIIKKEGKHIETNTFVLTFNTPIVPKDIRIFYRNIKIELYILFAVFGVKNLVIMNTSAVHLLFVVNVDRKVFMHQLVQTLLNVQFVVRIILLTQIKVKYGLKSKK